MKRLLVLCGATLALGLGLLGATRSQATPIGPACGTCQGSIYEISYTGVPIASTATTKTWAITYTINTSGYSGGGTHLDTVALKVSSGLVSADLVSAPGGIGIWNETLGGINANGCSGSGSGFDCVEATSVGVSPVVPGGTYTWVFNLEIANGGLFTDNNSSVKARYVNDSGGKVGDLVSENITLTLVPEPSTALLFALGGSLLAARRSKRR
jgi:hypothetical protein